MSWLRNKKIIFHGMHSYFRSDSTCPMNPGQESSVLMAYVNSKGSDQPVHLHSLVRALHCLHTQRREVDEDSDQNFGLYSH